jgi:3-deoxy-manno-octulosonate cytidylyltransferase (CMP-KDO synthetase)
MSRAPGATVWAVIPARYQSSRFPGKALAEISGKPMIQHVYERVNQTPSIERVLVATDDERIEAAVLEFGGEAIRTGDHPTGTDRIAEAVRIACANSEPPAWVLNVQGDEPMINSRDLETLTGGMAGEPEGKMGTLVYPLQNEAELQDPNVVKAVLDEQGRALYFSRSPLPYPRGSGGLGWRHLGVYLFRTDFLHIFAAMPPTPLSEREQLEQLRVLEHGHHIHCFRASTLTIGVDVPEDISRAEELLRG